MTERKRVLFYGDSNTYGYDPRGFMCGSYPEEQRWTEIVRRRLKDTWEIMDDGMNGREIPSSALTLQALDRTLKRCVPLNLFAVMLGSNDLLFSSPDPTLAAEKMKQMLIHVKMFLSRHNCAGRRSSKEAVSSCQILLIAPPQDLSGGEPLRQASLHLADLYQELAVQEHCQFLDLSREELSLAFDGLHFTEKGHRQMALLIEPILLNQ